VRDVNLRNVDSAYCRGNPDAPDYFSNRQEKQVKATKAMHEATARLQTWRPSEFTDELAESMAAEGIPFCFDCADWHQIAEDHSMTIGDDK
jgi:hypothetical protein